MNPIKTFPAFDHVLDGGLHPGQVVLLSGSSGSRKTSLALLAANIFAVDRPVLYASIEQNTRDIESLFNTLLPGKPRAEHLHIQGDQGEQEDEGIIERILGTQQLTVIDSLNAFSRATLEKKKAIMSDISEHCKKTDTNAIVIACATDDITPPFKTENIAGTSLLIEPYLDEIDGTLKENGLDEKLNPQQLRVLVCRKNRYGSTKPKAFLYTHSDGKMSWEQPRKN